MYINDQFSHTDKLKHLFFSLFLLLIFSFLLIKDLFFINLVLIDKFLKNVLFYLFQVLSFPSLLRKQASFRRIQLQQFIFGAISQWFPTSLLQFLFQ